MNRELEVGKFVRTKAGMIAKIISKDNVSGSLHKDEIVFILDNGNKLALHSRKVIKASHNIIDLIKVGDYVNGFPVIHKENDILKCGLLVQFKENEIKSIITKEQMESLEYKVD